MPHDSKMKQSNNLATEGSQMSLYSHAIMGTLACTWQFNMTISLYTQTYQYCMQLSHKVSCFCWPHDPSLLWWNNSDRQSTMVNHVVTHTTQKRTTKHTLTTRAHHDHVSFFLLSYSADNFPCRILDGLNNFLAGNLECMNQWHVSNTSCYLKVTPASNTSHSITKKLTIH